MKALTFREIQIQKKLSVKKDIILFLDHIGIIENVAGISRLADAFGIKKIILLNCNVNQVNKIEKQSRSTFSKLDKIIVDSLEDIPNSYDNYQWIGLEWTTESLELYKSKFEDKIVLILGNEKYGISEQLLTKVDKTIHIPMLGTNSSMNVTSATGIALYEIRRQELQSIN